MKVELNEQEIINALAFLARVDLKGNESEAHVQVKYKLSAMLNELKNPPVEETPIDEPIPELEAVEGGKKDATKK